MATESYWADCETLLDGPAGMLATMPMTDEAVIGYGPTCALDDALKLLVLRRNADAHRLLNSFAPRLRTSLESTDWLGSVPPGQRTGRLYLLAENMNVAEWLLEGEFGRVRAKQAAVLHVAAHREYCPRAKLDGLQLLHHMLLSIEAGEAPDAGDAYLRYEKQPLAWPPSSPRFGRNARSLLYAHLNRERAPKDLLPQATENFRAAATKWERGLQPLPHVGFVEAARTLWHCHSLQGRKPDLAAITQLLR